ncbi:hypothetical protein Ae201684P_008736 [Aphanomyces euteiches]|nr:hypothetical protein Ae201684P_008736 [Aphanomyces euteiches]
MHDRTKRPLNELAQIDRLFTSRQLASEDIDHTPEGFIKLWAYVIYADTEDDLNIALRRLENDFLDQAPLLKYIHQTYLPVKHQWVQCYISQNENYGMRTNSPTETAHKEIKSYVINGTSDLFAVFAAVNEMLKNKENDYLQRTAAFEV